MHIFSTLFTASTVVNELSQPEKLDAAVAFCKEMGLKKVYIESFRGVFAEKELLRRVRDRFEAEGFLAYGCVTTVSFGKRSDHYDAVVCYTDQGVRDFLKEIFERTASVFDTIMIDDFLFTDCECAECKAAKGSRTFAEYRSEILNRVSREYILEPAHRVNPNCKVIIKYPLWYDEFQTRGYDVTRQTRDFDLTWGGTETREPDSEKWGRYPQTQGFYMMYWDVLQGGGKCGGGWYDTYATLEPTYLEQARQTVLGKAEESMLFCAHDIMHGENGRKNVAALKPEMRGLEYLAYLIDNKEVVGVAVPKKPGYDPQTERYLSSFYGMLAIPVRPEIGLPDDGTPVILGTQAIGFEDVAEYAETLPKRGIPAVLTKGFADWFAVQSADGIPAIDVGDDNWNLVDLPEAQLEALRDYLTKPLGLTVRCPVRVALNLYDDDMEVLQNFNDVPVTVELDLFGRNPKIRKLVHVLSEGKQVTVTREGTKYTVQLPARTLAVLN